jgi:aminopeptidase N
MNHLYCRRLQDLLEFGYTHVSRHGRRAFALSTARPHFAPDRVCDVLHIALILHLDLAQKTLRGTCATTVQALSAGVTALTLDAVDLQIVHVRLANGTALCYDYDSRHLRISFAPALGKGEEATIEIDYGVTKPRLGLYFIEPDAVYPDKPVQVWTQCQDEDARYWFPCFDAPHDKATTAITVTVPQPYFALSNGELLATEHDDVARTTTYYWLQDQPHSTYLMTLVVGDFSEHTEMVGSLPVQWYVSPGREADAQRAFGDTPEMVRFFSTHIGVPYPWRKYAQVAVTDFVFGGMENTSATTQTALTLHDERAHLDFSSNGLVAHELAHQWFGNLLTCKHWSHAWLNEGFATYFDALFLEHHKGTDEFRYAMYQNAKAYFREDSEQYRRALVTNVYTEPIDLFDHHLYEKGALVLHMIRHLLGDDCFWQAMRHYVSSYAYQVVETVDLERAIEAVSGHNLQAFFTQWVYQGGYPHYQVEWTWDEATKVATVTVLQQQQTGSEHGVETPWFDMPITLLCVLPAGKQQYSLRIHEQRHTFHLSLPGKPRWMSFDPGNWVLKKLTLKLPKDMLQAQLQHDPDPIGRMYAAMALGELGGLEAVTCLRQALQHDPFWGVQAEIATVLGTMHTPEALTALLTHTRLAHPKARRAVVSALGEFKEERAAAALGEIIAGDESYFVEAEAAAALGKTRSQQALTPLLQASQKASWNEVIRAGVFRGLAELQEHRAIPLLDGFTAYGQPVQARYAAIRALGKLGGETEPAPEAIINTLTALLDEDSFRTRMAVLDALESLNSPKTLAALQRMQQRDLDGRVKRRLDEIIEAIRSNRKQTDEVQKLRDDVQALQNDNQKLMERLDRLEARQSPVASEPPG